MAKKLYVHVGTPKTGTSAIQQFCATNKEAFEKRGYCYPIMPYRYPHKAIVRNGHFLTGQIKDENGNRCIEEERRIFLEGMETVKELFITYNCVILSDETLWRSTTHWRPELWKELNKMGEEVGFEVVIIVYLRRQDEYLTSLWSQDVKAGYFKSSVKSWEDWYEIMAKDKLIDYKAKVDEFINAVGKENVVVRRYDRNGFFGGSIYSDFLQAVGLEMTADFVVEESERNLGLKGNTNEIKRIINTIPDISHKDHLFFRNILLGLSDISAQNYKCSVMSKEEKEELLADCKEGNREVAKLIFEEDGELFKNDDKELPKWEKDNPYMMDDVIRLVATTALELRKENQKLEEKIHRLEAEIREMKNPVTYYPKKLYRKIKRSMNNE
ncbi:MAG: hypothetical protein J6A75_04450 [Lachnospiraceae bacterium]|nr:hypothetical protein [Lachnospiraceae bacterium]